ncbi:MAG: bifunctional phosphoribosylaminoimidazolecarboxamide formyltransferase/inosine monophosphate cyclohydrolase [Deltaproteobacteria bacterium CG11_big_fil_rev_8_21_14_0_20_45_16]|nr:MAG: bifunctional phosphoribosylaminoimidazolecarboxamide formyltransferase/inosine monophosphate cyclohydrolase [Deltaproteobacteria bacterium CG11_big_fil_rev_8_21_14_0_20_45_16]
MIKRALISVSDKTGLIELGKALKHFQVEIISTGGTAAALREANIETTSVSDYTGFPEMMEGRLKTLHPRVHGALLGKRHDPQHEKDAMTYGIKWVDLVVVNLYPFEKVATETKKPAWSSLIENIDIGGPAMIRAAAKNHEYVTVVVQPKDYKDIIQRLKQSPQNPFDLAYRYKLAMKAFRHTAIYDSSVAEHLSQYEIDETKELQRKNFPLYHSIHGKLQQDLRYGENPHQKAAVYRLTRPQEYFPVSQSLQGKELSFNNFLDADAGWRCLLELPPKSCVILKHNNPCGAGWCETEEKSYVQAWKADSESAFGGIVAISGHIEGRLAERIVENFFEIICAESFSVEAREIFQRKKNLRLMHLPKVGDLKDEQRPYFDFRKVTGAYLLQDTDYLGSFNDYVLGPDLRCVTEKNPSDEELRALRMGWIIAKNLKSNAVVIANGEQTLGIGCGDVNRKFATQSALMRSANLESKLKVCGSDGFFPFPDSIELLKQAGVTAIIQPGGSMRDQQVIDACNQSKISMLFTGIRHFRH